MGEICTVGQNFRVLRARQTLFSDPDRVVKEVRFSMTTMSPIPSSVTRQTNQQTIVVVVNIVVKNANLATIPYIDRRENDISSDTILDSYI